MQFNVIVILSHISPFSISSYFVLWDRERRETVILFYFGVCFCAELDCG